MYTFCNLLCPFYFIPEVFQASKFEVKTYERLLTNQGQFYREALEN